MPGKSIFEYSIIPHKGNWKEAYQQVYAFETHFRAIATDLHAGELPDEGSFIFHTPAEFVISAVKESENGEGVVVRGYNISTDTIQLNLKPFINFRKVFQVNLAEESLAVLNTDNDGGVSLSVSGHKVISIMFIK